MTTTGGAPVEGTRADDAPGRAAAARRRADLQRTGEPAGRWSGRFSRAALPGAGRGRRVPDGTGELADDLAHEFPGRVDVAAPNGTARPRAIVRRRDAASARAPMPTSSARWTRTSRTIPSYLPDLVAATDRYDLVIGSRYLHGISRRQLAAAAADPQHVRQLVRPRDHGARPPRLHRRLPLLAARGAREDPARSHRVGWLRVRGRDDIRGLAARVPDWRGAHRLRRAARGDVEDLLRCPGRIRDHAVAAHPEAMEVMSADWP